MKLIYPYVQKVRTCIPLIVGLILDFVTSIRLSLQGVDGVFRVRLEDSADRYYNDRRLFRYTFNIHRSYEFELKVANKLY